MGSKEFFDHIDDVATATIANGASLSDAVVLMDTTPVKIVVPADTEGTALTFQGSLDGTTFYDLYDEYGVEVNFPFTDPCIVSITNPLIFYGLKAMKIRTGTSASASAQTGAAALTVAMVGV